MIAHADTITCQECGTTTPYRGAMQKYCPTCSEKRDLERKRLWAREHPPPDDVRRRKVSAVRRAKVLSKEAGAEISRENASDITWALDPPPTLLWWEAISVPFSYAASKNHIYALQRRGHLHLRGESRAVRDEITLRLRQAIARGGVQVVQNKVWLDIMVQKPNHRGDAINVVDLVCDAAKAALGVDDRWFCIRRLDWEVVKISPRLFVCVGQDVDIDAQVCSSCGAIKPLDAYNKSKHNKMGVGRTCRECLRLGRLRAKEQACQN